MKRPTMPVPSRRGLTVGAWVVALLTLTLIVWMLWLLFTLQAADEESRADRERLGSQVTEQGQLLAEQQAKLDKANERLVDAGERPVTVPPEVVEGVAGQPGERGDVGPPGPRGFPGLDGRDGLDGKDGARGFTGERGATGAPGRDGEDGSDGQDGAPGAPGERGATGPPGPQGPGGPPGPQGPPQSCESEFVCAGELQGVLANYFTKGDVVAMFRALGCTVSTTGGNPNQTFTCTITGKP